MAKATQRKKCKGLQISTRHDPVVSFPHSASWVLCTRNGELVRGGCGIACSHPDCRGDRHRAAVLDWNDRFLTEMLVRCTDCSIVHVSVKTTSIFQQKIPTVRSRLVPGFRSHPAGDDVLIPVKQDLRFHVVPGAVFLVF